MNILSDIRIVYGEVIWM